MNRGRVRACVSVTTACSVSPERLTLPLLCCEPGRRRPNLLSRSAPAQAGARLTQTHCQEAR
jgi:hypothetical protein